MGYGGGWNPLSDCPVEDAEPAMIVGPQGAASPLAKEVVFPTEEIHFVHKIFCNMMIECCFGWFAEWWELSPVKM